MKDCDFFISSTANEKIKYAVRLREDAQFRKQEKKVLLCGAKIVNDVAPSIAFEAVFSTEPSDIDAKAFYYVNRAVMAKLTGHDKKWDMAAIVALPESKKPAILQRALVLDGIADPGNMGTLLRSAWGLGVDAVWMENSSCDPSNDKALRASQGALFHIPVFCESFSETLPLFVADACGENVEDVDIPKSWALVLGNEGHGVSDGWKKAKKIALPMQRGLESLNVAAAGAILMYIMGKAHAR